MLTPKSPAPTMHQRYAPPMHDAMHGAACPSTPAPFEPRPTYTEWNYIILLLFNQMWVAYHRRKLVIIIFGLFSYVFSSFCIFFLLSLWNKTCLQPVSRHVYKSDKTTCLVTCLSLLIWDPSQRRAWERIGNRLYITGGKIHLSNNGKCEKKWKAR